MWYHGHPGLKEGCRLQLLLASSYFVSSQTGSQSRSRDLLNNTHSTNFELNGTSLTNVGLCCPHGSRGLSWSLSWSRRLDLWQKTENAIFVAGGSGTVMESLWALEGFVAGTAADKYVMKKEC